MPGADLSWTINIPTFTSCILDVLMFGILTGVMFWLVQRIFE